MPEETTTQKNNADLLSKKQAEDTANAIITINDLNTYNGTEIKADNLIGTIIWVLVLGEAAINKKDVVYWSAGKNLNKHRETREFDEHVQKMLLYLEKIGDFCTVEVPCGNNGYYRTKVQNSKTRECVLIVHSYDRNAMYMQEYFQMNADLENPRFALIQYDLSSSHTMMQDLKIIIPTSLGKSHKSVSLMPYVQQVRTVKASRNNSVSEHIESIKNLLAESKDNYLEESDIKGDA